MPERPQLPPPNFPIPESRTPNSSDVFVRIVVSRQSALYRENQPIDRGRKYSALKNADERFASENPELYFINETVPIGSNTIAGMTQQEFVIWNFMTVPAAESVYNAEISLIGDVTNNPVFARVYTVRRKDYEASPYAQTGTTLTALLGARVLNGGFGYTQADITLVGPGSGGKLRPVINDGIITDVVVDAEGEDYDGTLSSAQVIGDGQNARIALYVQSYLAVLTSQKKMEFDDSDDRKSEFVKVLKVWEVLPGPLIPFTRYDGELGHIRGTRRAVLNTGQKALVQPSFRTNYEGRDGSKVVLIETTEDWGDGTGRNEDNQSWPTLHTSSWDQRGTFDRNTRLILKTQSNRESTFERVRLATGQDFITETTFEPYPDNPFIARMIIEQWVEVTVDDIEYTSEFGGGLIAHTERIAEPGAVVPDQGLTVVSSVLQKLSPHEQKKINRFLYGLPSWPILNGAHTDEKTGIRYLFTKQVINANTALPALSGYRGPFVEDQPYDRWKTIRIITRADCTSLPPQEVRPITRSFTLPPRLLSIEAVWNNEVSKFAEAHASTDNITVSVFVRSGSRGGVIITRRGGFRGKADGFWVRDYRCGPFLMSESEAPLKILPSSGSIVFFEATSTAFASGADLDTGSAGSVAGAAFSTRGGKVGDEFEQRIHEFDISDHLVGSDLQIINPYRLRDPVAATGTSTGSTRGVGLIQGGAASVWNARMEVRVPISSPEPSYLRGLNYILDDVEYEEMPFGIWCRHRFYVSMAGMGLD